MVSYMSTCHDHNYTTEKRAAWNIVNVYKIKHSQQSPFEHRVTDKQNVPVSDHNGQRKSRGPLSTARDCMGAHIYSSKIRFERCWTRLTNGPARSNLLEASINSFQVGYSASSRSSAPLRLHGPVIWKIQYGLQNQGPFSVNTSDVQDLVLVLGYPQEAQRCFWIW